MAIGRNRRPTKPSGARIRPRVSSTTFAAHKRRSSVTAPAMHEWVEADQHRRVERSRRGSRDTAAPAPWAQNACLCVLVRLPMLRHLATRSQQYRAHDVALSLTCIRWPLPNAPRPKHRVAPHDGVQAAAVHVLHDDDQQAQRLLRPCGLALHREGLLESGNEVLSTSAGSA